MSSPYESLPPLTSGEIGDVYRKFDPHYVEFSGNERLIIPAADWRAMVAAGAIEIPEGPWSITEHPNRLAANPHNLSPIYTAENPVPVEQTRLWQAAGLLVDTAGRALHPRAEQMLTGPGMFTQPGAHYGNGPQPIGNCGLRRVRNGVAEYATVWADRSEPRLRGSLPGGYARKGETAQRAAVRELGEETGISLDLGSLAVRQNVIPPHPYYKNTLHAWTEEWFVFVDALDDLQIDLASFNELHTQDPGEVRRAMWMSVEAINLHPDFLGAHRRQILVNEAQRR